MNSLSFFEKITLSKASGSVQWHIKFQPIVQSFLTSDTLSPVDVKQ